MKFGLWLFELQTPPRLSSGLSSLPNNLATLEARSPSQDFVKAIGQDLQKLHANFAGQAELATSIKKLQHDLKIDATSNHLDTTALQQRLEAEDKKSKHRLSQLEKLSRILTDDPQMVQFEAALGFFAQDESIREMIATRDKKSREALLSRDLNFSFIVQAHAFKRVYPKAFDKSQQAQLVKSFKEWTEELKSEASTSAETDASSREQVPDPSPAGPPPQLVWIQGYPSLEIENAVKNKSTTEPGRPNYTYLTMVGPDQFVVTNSRDLMQEVLGLALSPRSKSQDATAQAGVLSAQINTQRIIKNLPDPYKNQAPAELQQLSSLRANLDLNEKLSLELSLAFDGSNGQDVVQKLYRQVQGLLQMTQLGMAGQSPTSESATVDLSEPLSPASAMRLLTQKNALRIEPKESSLLIHWHTPLRPYMNQALDYAKAESTNATENHAALTALESWIKLASASASASTPDAPAAFETLELQRVRNPQDADAHYFGSVGGLPDAYQTLAVLINPKCKRTTLVQAHALYPELTPQDLAVSPATGTTSISTFTEPLSLVLKPLTISNPKAVEPSSNPPPASLTRSAQQASWSPLVEYELSNSSQQNQVNGQTQVSHAGKSRRGDFVLRLSYVDEESDFRAPANSVLPQDLLGAMQALAVRSNPCQLQSGGPRLIFRKLSAQVAGGPAPGP